MYIFVTTVEPDGLVDLTAASVDGQRGVTISAFGVSFLALPIALHELHSIRGREVHEADVSPSMRETRAYLDCRVITLQNAANAQLGHIVCREVVMLSHSWQHQRIGYNTQRVRNDPSSRIILEWREIRQKAFVFPTDQSLF